eukprot:2442848-Prymnesium_polylepis.2
MLAALLFADMCTYTAPGGTDKWRCFVTEVLKDPETESGFGRWGPAMLWRLATRLQKSGVEEMDLITRYQHGRKVGQFKPGEPFDFTKGARKLFGEMGFKSVWHHNVGEEEPDDDTRPAAVLLCYTACSRGRCT